MARAVSDDVVGIEAMKIEECVAAALIGAATSISDAQQGSLVEFHLQFGQLMYDTF